MIADYSSIMVKITAQAGIAILAIVHRIRPIFQLLSENPTSLPVVVVEGESRAVVGMISTWEVLAEISAVLGPKLGGSSCFGEVPEDSNIETNSEASSDA